MNAFVKNLQILHAICLELSLSLGLLRHGNNHFQSVILSRMTGFVAIAHLWVNQSIWFSSCVGVLWKFPLILGTTFALIVKVLLSFDFSSKATSYDTVFFCLLDPKVKNVILFFLSVPSVNLLINFSFLLHTLVTVSVEKDTYRFQTWFIMTDYLHEPCLYVELFACQ